MEAIPSPVHNPEEIESALAAISKESAGGLVVMPDTFTTVNRNQIIKSVTQNRTPAQARRPITPAFGERLSSTEILRAWVCAVQF
jgi:hypothetical protein